VKKSMLIALLLLSAACRQEAASRPAPPVKPAGPAMPAYKAQWLDGKPFDLAGQKGSVVLLNLWATWCGPCRFEIPDLEKLHTQYAGRGFKVIGVSLDEGGAKDVRPFVADQKIIYPIALDPDGKIATILDASVIPTSVLVDKAGSIVWKHSGIVDTKDPALLKALESALAR
jgi:cytochrome c biogenesis protein CcmG, thiol:disulfide interchange protein DsbE